MKYLYQNKYWEPAKEYDIDKILYLMIDRPNEINNKIPIHTNLLWLNINNQDHRDYDLPSCIYNYNNNNKNVSLYWYTNTKLHRLNDKPSIIYFNGCKEYHIDGKFIKEG